MARICTMVDFSEEGYGHGPRLTECYNFVSTSKSMVMNIAVCWNVLLCRLLSVLIFQGILPPLSSGQT